MGTYSKTAFQFTREFGLRLRELRRRQGLTLRNLALLMDRQGKGSYNQLARLERGEVMRPSVNLIADYLRACRASFRELCDLLDAYTSQRPVLKLKGDEAVAGVLACLPGPQRRAMLTWERKVAAAQETPVPDQPKRKPRVQTPEQRVFRVIWTFIHANWNEVLEQKLFETLQRLGQVVPRRSWKPACGRGRRMFKVLTRDYADEKRRPRGLELAQRRARAAGFSDEVVAALLQAVTEAYEELKRSGRLDWEPTEEQVVQARGKAPQVLKAETRLDAERTRPQNEYDKMYGYVDMEVGFAVQRELEKLRLDGKTQDYYRNWVKRLVGIAAEHGVDSAEWQTDVDATAPKMHDETIARSLVRIATARFEELKHWLPPKPPRPPRV